jgi:CheY-like chemotaxis protein
MVTARVSGENRVQGFRAGASDYIAKPYTPDQIFGALAQADSWRRRVDDLDHGASLSLDSREDVAHFRHANDLRSLLLERTLLGEESINRMATSLAAILERGVDWGRAHGRARVADLSFRVDPGKFSLTLHDESGWLSDDDPRRDGLARAIDEAGFDDVDFRENSLRLARSLPVE